MTKVASYLEKSAFLALAALFFLVPFMISFRSFDQFGIPKFFLLVLLTAFLAIALFLRSFFVARLKFPRFTLVPMIFFGLLVLSTLTAPDIQVSIWGNYRRLDGLASYLTVFTVISAMVAVLTTSSRIFTLLRLICLGAFSLSLYGVLQFFGIDIWSGSNFPFEPSRSFATFGNPDLFASYLIIVIPLYFYFIITSRKKLFYYIAVFVSLFALTASGTRAGLVAFACGSTLLFLFCLRDKRDRAAVLRSWSGNNAEQGVEPVGQFENEADSDQGILKKFYWFAAVSLSAILLVTLLASGQKQASDPITRFQDINISEGSTAQRISIFRVVPPAAVANPLLGEGSGSFRFAFERHRTKGFVVAAGDKTIADNAHNIYFQLVVENGFVVMLAFMWLFVFVLIKFLHQSFVKKKLDQLAAKGERTKTADHGKPPAFIFDLRRTILRGVLAVSAISYGTNMLFGIQEITQALFFWGIVALYLIVLDDSLDLSFRAAPAGYDAADGRLKYFGTFKSVYEDQRRTHERDILRAQLESEIRVNLAETAGMAEIARIEEIPGLSEPGNGSENTESQENKSNKKNSGIVGYKNKIIGIVFWGLISILMISLFFEVRNMVDADANFKARSALATKDPSKNLLILSGNAARIFPGFMLYRQKEIEDLLRYSERFNSELKNEDAKKDDSLIKALVKAKLLLADEPRELDHYALLAKGQILSGSQPNKASDLVAAVATTSKGIGISPYWLAGHKLKAEALFKLKRYREAYQSAETAYQLSPSDPDAKEMRDFYRANMRVHEKDDIKTR